MIKIKIYTKLLKSKLYIITFFLMLGNNTLLAQYIDILNQESNNFLLNPAHSGNHSYKWQYVNTYQTLHFLSPDNLKSAIVYGDGSISFFPNKLSFGVGLYSTQYSNTPFLNNMFFANSSFHKQYRRQFLHVGILVASQSIKINTNQLFFPDQYDRNSGSYSSNISTNEIIDQKYAHHFDINAGFIYGLKYKSSLNELGISMLRLNNPAIHYGINKEWLNKGFTVLFKNKWFLTQKVTIISLLNYIDLNVKQKIAGISLNYSTNQMSEIIESIKPGIYIKDFGKYMGNSIVLNFSVSSSTLTIDMSYNFNISNPSKFPVNYRLFQLSLFIHGFSPYSNRFSVPCNYNY